MFVVYVIHSFNSILMRTRGGVQLIAADVSEKIMYKAYI